MAREPAVHVIARRLGAALLVAALACSAAVPARAQCPDGTPPPCAAQRRAAARRPQPPPPDARSRRLLLLPFRNVTRLEAHQWLEVGAPLMLGQLFSQYRELTVVTEQQLLAVWRRLGLAADATPDAVQMRRLAEETGGWTVVSGDAVATGGRLLLGARALDAVTGTVLVRAEVEVAADADVRPAFDQLAIRLLEVAGLPPQTTDVAALTTRSLDAYRAYVRGVTLLSQSAFTRAREALREAVRLDSGFAMAWARLALSGMAWNIGELVNPFSPTYAEARRAVALAGRLPPRHGAYARLLAALLAGRLGAARELGDSLAGTDPNDLDVREALLLLEMVDPVLDPASPVPRPRGSVNRAVAMAREVLEKDPGRRSVYSVFGYVYGVAGGLWTGSVDGVRTEATSLAATLTAPTITRFVPVLGDSFELMTEAAFEDLPEAERARHRRRAADAGMLWMRRWLAAGPDDADAHLWTSRMAELQGDWELALRETDAALALGVESQMESAPGRRVMLLVRSGRIAAAAALADSLMTAGSLRRPMFVRMDRGWSFGVAALLLSGRWANAVELAGRGSALDASLPRCSAVVGLLAQGNPESLPREVARSVSDTIATRAGELAADETMRPCLPDLERVRSGPR